ncbi:MAG: ABC transporter permease [Planctomycetota bacterium]
MSEQRHVRLAAAKRWPMPDLREIWHYRELLATLAGRDLKLRYKQTALGLIWAIFPPLVAAAIFTYIRGFLQLETPGNAPSILFVLAGFVGFTVFRDTLDRSGQSLLTNQHLVSKIYFPRLLLPLAATLSVLFDHAIMLGLVAVVWMACGLIFASNPDVLTPLPGLHLLMWPVVTLLSVMLASGFGMVVAALSSHFRDFKHVVPVALQLLLYASPVFYDLSLPLARDNGWVILLNPLSGLIAAYRWSLTGIGMVHWPAFAASAAVAIVVFVVGSILFRRVEGRLADVI